MRQIDPRRLLVITYYFPPHSAIGGQRWAGISKYLTRVGWEVAVLTAVAPAREDTANGVHVESCRRRPTLIDAARLLRRLILGRAASASRDLGPSGQPAWHHQLKREIAALMTFPDESRGWMLRAALRTRGLIKRFRPRVVVSSGPPHAAHLVARLATIGTLVPWFVDLRDPWAGPLTKAWASHPWFGSLVFRALSTGLERRVFRAANGVITNTPQLAEALAVRYPDARVVCVPNGVDLESLPAKSSHPLPGMSIVYAGTLYGSRDLGPVVQAFRIFLRRCPEAADAGSKLRIAGEGDARQVRNLNDAIVAAGIEPHVEVLGPLPRAEALNLVSRSRLAVVLAQEQGLQTPGKLYELAAMDIPTLVLTEAGSAADAAGAGVGALVRDPADVDGIAGVLEQLWREDWRPQPQSRPPITYQAIAPLVDQLLRNALRPGLAPRRRNGAWLGSCQ